MFYHLYTEFFLLICCHLHMFHPSKEPPKMPQGSCLPRLMVGHIIIGIQWDIHGYTLTNKKQIIPLGCLRMVLRQFLVGKMVINHGILVPQFPAIWDRSTSSPQGSTRSKRLDPAQWISCVPPLIHKVLAFDKRHLFRGTWHVCVFLHLNTWGSELQRCSTVLWAYSKQYK